MTHPASVAEDEVKAVASMASLALALLGFFTNVRREALKDYLRKVPTFSHKTVVAALPDILLAVFTAGAILVMAPLLFDVFSFGDVGRRAGALESMFALIWLGFALLLAFQLSIVFRRFKAAPHKKAPKATTTRAGKNADVGRG